MKKIVTFGLCFLLVLSSFVICFADASYSDVPSPAFLPVSDSPSSVIYSIDGVDYSFSSSSSPTYIVLYSSPGESNFRWLVFSENSGTTVYSNDGSSTSSFSLTSQHNGYFYKSGVINKGSSLSTSVPLLSMSASSSAGAVIDAVDSSVFSVSFDLTSLVDGSISWLSSMAQAVKANGLLLFFVLTIFVGVGIGLINRFRKE